MLESALIAGLISIGAEVMRLGIISTPGVAYLTRDMGAELGVMISASHNPVADNGIKFFGSDGFKLSDEQENEIEALLDQETQNYQDQLAMILYIIQITLKGTKIFELFKINSRC